MTFFWKKNSEGDQEKLRFQYVSYFAKTKSKQNIYVEGINVVGIDSFILLNGFYE